ncbi:MAG: single-stranded DNA-binding protein [Thiobacillus sp.]|jgi:single-strand DNA-binding protein|uniref:single-stranded DNA-binding protein n=1 Tax=Thiobacillus sp. TaxID=924 RepID=UPI002895D733|nr:single-stranded DNA-binding protein [Thiobacillus sp.]MDT3706759.1 single-stranded DNA-binding protein [Thiobacillus sp.]
MASVNKVILIGNLGRDPEMRYLPSGEAVANLAIATTDKYKDKSGQMVEQTEWHRVSFFGRTAEVCGQYLKKGSQVYVEGSIRTRKYTDKEGVEKYATEIRGDRMQMLGSRAGGGMTDMDDGFNQSPPPQRSQPRSNTQTAGTPAAAQRPASSGFDDMDDDIPF